MNGQGSPKSWLALCNLTRHFVLGLVMCCCCALSQLSAEVTSVRVRFEWSGPEPDLWIGSIGIPGGSISDFRVLGLDPDQPGAYVNQGERVLVFPRFATSSSGFEAMVSGELTDVIHVALAAESDRTQGVTFDINIADILAGDIERELGRGHKLIIRRAIGDELRIRFPSDSMVFAPGDTPKIDLRPIHVDAKAGSTLRARFRIRDAEDPKGDVAEFWQLDEDLWSRTETLRVDETGQVDPLFGIEIPIPDTEGSYNLTIDLSYRLPAVGNVARRTVQFVVVDPRRPPLFGNGAATLIAEFDPADPDWRDYLAQLQSKSTLIPGLRKGPWSNVSPFVRNLQGTDWTHLQGKGWVAYMLHGAKPGVPHILDVKIPPDVEQDVGVSIIEPKFLAELDQIHNDTGISIGDQDLVLPGVSSSTQATQHRVVFWPKSSTPVVVISNRRSEGTAAFGAIRLEAYHQGLPTRQPINGARNRIAVLEGKLLQEIFRADEQSSSHNGPDSWRSFLLAGRRLVAYLRYAGYDGAAIKIASEGSALFPSRLLTPTANFDRGIFALNRRDPFQKDVLEMLFQLFDREGLTLIPSLEFATPLPELEEILARQQPDAVGIELYDTGQRRGSDLPTASTGLAAYYNPLDVRVQRAMGRVVHEIMRRYERHPSLRGINVDFHAQGFTHLPGSQWAFDNATLNRFVAATKKENPGWSMENVGGSLATQLHEQASSVWVDAWLRWRAERLTSFYVELANLVGRNGDRQLFLSMTDLMRSEPWQQRLRPALPRETTVQSVLMELGLDVQALQQAKNLMVLRPHRIAPLDHLGSQAVNLEANEQDIQQSFETKASSAAQFDYEARIIQYDAFDAEGPTRRHRHQFLATTIRGGVEARRHLALSLAEHDDHWIFEGGRTLPFGQESASDSFFDVFRVLPRHSFDEVKFEQAGPIVVRVSTDADQTIAYYVNTSPWKAITGIQWRAPRNVTATRLGSSPKVVKPTDLGDRSNLDVEIEPYGMVALQFSSRQVELVGCQAELPAGIAQQLRVQLDEIRARGEQIEAKKPIQLLADSSFEGALTNSWTATENAGASATLDAQTKAHGNASLRLFASLPNSPVRVTSHEFLAPETGRLVVLLKLRKGESVAPPPVMLRLESSNEAYQPFHFFTSITSDRFSDEGVNFVDLPTDPDLRLRISLELAGPGEVWIDEIRLYDRWILDEEEKDLKKIIQRAVAHESNGNLAACYQTLSGYWPRFLLRHVPPARVAVRPLPAPVPKSDEAPPKSSRFFDLRKFVPRFR